MINRVCNDYTRARPADSFHRHKHKQMHYSHVGARRAGRAASRGASSGQRDPRVEGGTAEEEASNRIQAVGSAYATELTG